MVLRVVTLSIFIVSLVFAVSGCNSIPKLPGNIAIDVVDANGYPQGYCTVQIATVGSNTSLRQDTTDDNGHVFFGKLEPGEYKVYILNANEQEFTIVDDTTHKLNSGRTLNLTIKIDRDKLKDKTLSK